LKYVVFVDNDGEAVLSCDVTMRGLALNGATAGQDLQSNYSDRRRVSRLSRT
jgi:hypothetical protein